MNHLFPPNLEAKISKAGIIAVLVINNSEKAVKLARTLLNSGISAIELTLRTDAALDSLRKISESVPEMLIAAGTVLEPSQIIEVKKNGSSFAVAPGFNPEVLSKATEIGFPFAPGIATPSEIETAMYQGCRILKFFHAESLGGISYLRSINSPYKYKNVKYIPLGGVNPDNMRSYIEASEVIALGGSWIAPSRLIDNEDWDSIARNAENAVKIYQEIRG